MKTARSLLALLLSLLTVLCFAACDETADSPDGDTSTASSGEKVASSGESVSSEESSSAAPLTSVVGTWEYEENIMPLLKTGFAHDSKLAAIIKEVDIEVIQVIRIVITETDMTVSLHLDEDDKKALIDEFKSVNGTYESLELDRYESEAMTEKISLVDGVMKFEEGVVLNYTLGADSVTFGDVVNPDGEKAPAGDGNFFTGYTYKKVA